MEFTEEFLAKEAERLLKDQVLNYAVSRIMADALQELAQADATDADAIRRHQATYSVAKDFMTELARYVEAIDNSGGETVA